MFFLSALAFVVLLTFLILIHECGHFFAARAAKVVVEEFGFGLPPRAKTLFTRAGTVFSLNWIPFGGFVRLKGENAVDERERRAKGSFGGAPILSRIIILVAGVFMNFLLAILIFTWGFSYAHWIPRYASEAEMKAGVLRGDILLTPGIVISSVRADGTAVAAGVPAKSTLLAVDGEAVYVPSDVVAHQEGKTEVTYFLRDEAGKERTLSVKVADGKTGVELQFPDNVSAPPRSLWKGFLLALNEVRVSTVQTVYGMGTLFQSLFLTARVPEGITGIVGIAMITHSTVSSSFMQYLRLIADLSLSLAILNILPFPALDGGRLMFVLYELVLRRPAPRKFELTVNAVGFIFLITLILLITTNDIIRLF